MRITIVGYSDLNFTGKDGKPVDGIKVHYFVKSFGSNHFGYKVDTSFINRSEKDLIDEIKKLPPVSEVEADIWIENKKAYINGIIPIE